MEARSLTFSVTVGTYKLLPFIELNLRALRSVFGNSPLLCYDGLSDNSPRIKELADKFDCSYLNERVNRQHFLGDIQSAVCAVAFAQANGSDIAIKLNQRFVPLSPDIPDRLEEIFSDPKIDLAMPLPPKVETIVDDRSKFHSVFPSNPAFIAMRASAFDAQWLADSYSDQVRNSTHRNETLTEVFWAWVYTNKFKDRWKPIPWLSEPTNSPEYLQKCQHTAADYQNAATALGMGPSSFNTEEWQTMQRENYKPIPRL